MKSKLKKLPMGDFDFTIEHFKFSGAKVTLIHRPILEGHEPVLRTFSQNTESLSKYFKTLTGKEKWIVGEVDCLSIRGKLIRARVKPAKNPNYINLVSVLKVYKDWEELIFNSSNSVNRLENSCPVDKTREAK